MIDLKNTYIVNDKGELRDLYISALGRLGVDTSESDEHFLIYEPDDYPPTWIQLRQAGIITITQRS